MSGAAPSTAGRALCEVRYRSGASIGYRFRPGLVLTASKDRNLGDPQSVDLGHGHVASARILASRTGLGGRVSLLAVDGETASTSADDPMLERPADFTPGMALRADGAAGGYFLSLQDSRRLDFVASNAEGAAELPVGTPVFCDDRFVGIAARNRIPPEHWFLTFIRVMVLFFDEERRKAISQATGMQLGEQLLALVRSLRVDVTRLWSLYELLDHADFKRPLEAVATDAPASNVATEAAQSDAAAAGAGTAAQSSAASSPGAPRPPETVVLESSPRGIWVPLRRTPRSFPIAPTPAAAWIVIVLLVAITAAFVTAGSFPPGVQSPAPVQDTPGRIKQR